MNPIWLLVVQYQQNTSSSLEAVNGDGVRGDTGLAHTLANPHNRVEIREIPLNPGVGFADPI